ncbi:MAG: pyridoxal phosphate-dependent aminotransferase [Desulfovibrio sp.]|jgi:cystathionine beta-lyase|nr:pyridoxal phosphate-dependent aminotransferase [Desulfovibrio sp.]
MAGHDFDQIIDRTASDSMKWRYLPPGVLPMWVADSDFLCPSPVLEALQKRIAHGVLGYPKGDAMVEEAVRHWLHTRFDATIGDGWVVPVPGLCTAIAMIIETFTAPGDGVAAFTPSYPPIINLPVKLGRKSLHVPLVRENDGYAVDFDALEAALAQKTTTLFILCSPENPTGKVFTREELVRMGELCLKHGVEILSDEIHCDYVHHGRHVPFVALPPEIAFHGITATAPSKTFNMAGLFASAIVSPNRDKIALIRKNIDAHSLHVNVLGLHALHTAYMHCASYADEVCAYVGENLRHAVDFIRERIPVLRTYMPQGTYLLWIDCARLGLDRQGLTGFFMGKAKVGPYPGWEFGPEGEGFARLNLACPRSTVTEALERIAGAVASLGG